MGKPLFESEPCTRCGGSGHYSRCEMYGTTCFRCSGRKYTLTKRGEAAQQYYTALCSLPAKEIQPGMGVLFSGERKFRTVTFAGYNPSNGSGWVAKDGTVQPYFILEAEGYQCGTFEHVAYRVQQSAEQVIQKRAEALRYQESLGKNGLPRKTA